MPRRVRRLIYLGLLSLAVIIVVPGPYSDDGVWHTITVWGRDLSLTWELRERTFRLACGWRRVMLCQQLAALSGPLAPIADSVMRSVDELRCQQQLWTNRQAGLHLPGEERPMLYCHAIVRDTSLGLALDRGGFVAWVDRGWAATNPRTTYEEVVRRVASQHGAGRLCPQSDDMSTTDDVRWQLNGYNTGVYLALGRYVHLSYRYGPISCHTA